MSTIQALIRYTTPPNNFVHSTRPRYMPITVIGIGNPCLGLISLTESKKTSHKSPFFLARYGKFVLQRRLYIPFVKKT